MGLMLPREEAALLDGGGDASSFQVFFADNIQLRGKMSSARSWRDSSNAVGSTDVDANGSQGQSLLRCDVGGGYIVAACC